MRVGHLEGPVGSLLDQGSPGPARAGARVCLWKFSVGHGLRVVMAESCRTCGAPGRGLCRVGHSAPLFWEGLARSDVGMWVQEPHGAGGALEVLEAGQERRE